MKLGYNLHFPHNSIKIYIGTFFNGSGLILNGFIVLDTLFYDYDNFVSFFLFAPPTSVDVDAIIWYVGLKHIVQDRMNRLGHECLLGLIVKLDLLVYGHYLVGKTTRKPFGEVVRVELPLQRIHSYICDPMNVKARHGASYFITL